VIESPTGYAFALGLVAAVNPCGLPLLGGYLAFYTGSGQAARGSRIARSLVAGACITTGFLVVFAVLGLAVSGLQTALTEWSPCVMFGLGAFMTVIGVRSLSGYPPRILLPQLPFSPTRSVLAMAGFGAAYALGSLGCALPLFMVGVAGSFRAGFGGGLESLIAYALGMGLLVTAASVTSAAVGDSRAVRRLGPASRILSIASEALVVVIGIYVTVTSLLDVTAPQIAARVSDFASMPLTVVPSLFEAQPWVVGAVLTGIVGVAIIAVGVQRSGMQPPAVGDQE
jgi:cytochrome c-type biogenesis protein